MPTSGEKNLNFQMIIKADLSVDSYIEIAEYQMKFEEAVDLLRRNFDIVDFQIKQKRHREAGARALAKPCTEAVRKRSNLTQYEDL